MNILYILLSILGYYLIGLANYSIILIRKNYLNITAKFDKKQTATIIIAWPFFSILYLVFLLELLVQITINIIAYPSTILNTWMMEKNKWNKLTSKEKRILVAQDVIDSINIKKFLPARNGYLGRCELDDYLIDNKEDKISANKIINKYSQCSVCAKGACILSLANLNDEITIKDLNVLKHALLPWVPDILKDVFDKQTWNMIEIAYEIRSASSLLIDISKDIEIKCIEFGRKYGNQKDRMIAIMQNIIDNEGEFCP